MLLRYGVLNTKNNLKLQANINIKINSHISFFDIILPFLDFHDIVLVSFKKEVMFYKFMERMSSAERSSQVNSPSKIDLTNDSKTEEGRSALGRISSGTKVIDELLDGGFEKDILTTIYGPAGSGKTCSCILACVDVARSGGKVIYIDTEGGFSVERLKQIAPDYEKILENMVFFKPVNFEEQKDVFGKLKELANDKISLIVVDTISMLYRVELGKNNDVYKINKELGLQLSYLSEICRKKNIPIIITNQVYSNMSDDGGVNTVGGDIMKYSCKCMVELKSFKGSKRIAVLRKHRSIMNEKNVLFSIVQDGFKKEIKEK